MNSLNFDEFEKGLITTNEEMEQRKCQIGVKRPKSEICLSFGINTAQSTSNGRPKLSVLIVDDNPFNLLVLEKYLGMIKPIDITVDKCLNGERAVEMFKGKNYPGASTPYKLIFLDVQLPVMDGFQACLEINNMISKEGFERSSIIGISGLVEEVHRNVGLKVGMKKILSKPTNFAEINQICEDFIV
jgi:CheY-like chemotaxis protein